MASGIAPSPELVARFAGIQGMLQVKIADEELVEAAVEPAGFDSDEAAFAAAQGALVEEQRGGGVVGGEPCYIALKLPSLDAPSAWVLLLYIPAGSSVRDRMLYASTKDSLKKELGSSFFASDLYGNAKEELNYAAYTYKLESTGAGPTTAVEAELDDLALEESKAAAGGAQSGVAVAFSLKAVAREELQKLAKGEQFWVSLKVDTDAESVEHVESFAAGKLPEAEWATRLPADLPQFIFMAVEGVVALVYYCPDAAPIKQKMLCSTVKASVQAQAAKVGVTLTHNLEITRPSELVMASIREGSQAEPVELSASVQRVSKPSVKGGRRMPKRRPK